MAPVFQLLLGACAATDLDFTNTFRVAGRVTDQQGIRVAGALVNVASLPTSCTGGVQAFGQTVTDSIGRFAVTLGTAAGSRFDGCVEVTATSGIANTFSRVVVRLDSVRLDNLLRDSVYADVRVTRSVP